MCTPGLNPVADLQARGASCELLRERGADRVVNEHAIRADARLAGISELRHQEPFHRGFEVGVSSKTMKGALPPQREVGVLCKAVIAELR